MINSLQDAALKLIFTAEKQTLIEGKSDNGAEWKILPSVSHFHEDQYALKHILP
jgi:hypothetical protein